MRRAATFDGVGTASADEVARARRSRARLLSGEFGDIEPWDGFAGDLDAVLAERAA